MKIIYKEGDFLEGPEKYKLHGCNAQGVMNSGAALAVRNKYPDAFKVYRDHYRDHGLSVGNIICYKGEGVVILNAITQKYYGRNKFITYVSYDGVKDVMIELDRQAVGDSSGIPHIAMPKLGAGLANGKWSMIEKIIEEHSNNWQPVVYLL